MPSAPDVMTPLWRAVVFLRIVTALFAAGAIIVHHGGFVRPELGWAVLAAIAGWTVVTCLAYSHDLTRRIHMIVLDLLVTLALVASSVLVLSPAQLAEGTERAPLLTTIWASGPVLAAAVHAGRIAGVLFGLIVSLVDIWARGVLSLDILGDTVLLVGAGYVLGLAATTARRAAEQVRRAVRAEAAAGQRERRARFTTSPEEDLASALRQLASSRVEVAVPATEVPLPASDIAELVAVTRAVVDLSTQHTDCEPKVWVHVADCGAEVVLTIRDDGSGLADAPPAAGAGHEQTGISRSIRALVADLGGTLTVTTELGQGAEWEVRLARTQREL